MLPESERRALREIEEDLRANDPAFAAVLSHGRRFGEQWRWRALHVLADVTAGLMLVCGALTRDPELILWGMLGGAGLVATHVIRADPASTSDTPQ